MMRIQSQYICWPVRTTCMAQMIDGTHVISNAIGIGQAPSRKTGGRNARCSTMEFPGAASYGKSFCLRSEYAVRLAKAANACTANQVPYPHHGGTRCSTAGIAGFSRKPK